MRCPECERIESLTYEKNNLYFHFPTENTRSKFAIFLGTYEYNYETKDNAIQVYLEQGSMETFLLRATEALKENELKHTKVMILDAETGKDKIDATDFHRIIFLSELRAYMESGWLIDILEERRFISHFQPIFDKDGKSVFAHEALFRAMSSKGEIIPPDQVFGLAIDANLLFQLDLAARCSAVDCASEQGLGGSKLFINFNPSSIYDPSYCLKETTEYISKIGLKPEDIVFEVVESHAIENSSHLRGILTFYRKAGFDVALDDVGSGYSSLNLMRDLKPSYIKIDMELIRDVHQDDYRQNIVRNLINMAHSNQGKIICEGVESEQEMNWLVDHDADYIQGFYLGRPAEKLVKI